jgi:8-oxo-dGTP diphosphatase
MSEAERYDVTQYERPSVTVDVVIFSVVEGELKVLLIRRRNWPSEGMWAIPGGFVEIEEFTFETRMSRRDERKVVDNEIRRSGGHN